MALTALSLAFIPALARHKGGILNVGSVAGFLPGPGMAVYYASKAYVLSFSEALHEELKPHGIAVSCLCPGPTRTEFGEVAGFDTLLAAWAGFARVQHGLAFAKRQASPEPALGGRDVFARLHIG